jgi:hypothetical protein
MCSADETRLTDARRFVAGRQRNDRNPSAWTIRRVTSRPVVRLSPLGLPTNRARYEKRGANECDDGFAGG